MGKELRENSDPALYYRLVQLERCEVIICMFSRAFEVAADGVQCLAFPMDDGSTVMVSQQTIPLMRKVSRAIFQDICDMGFAEVAKNTVARVRRYFQEE